MRLPSFFNRYWRIALGLLLLGVVIVVGLELASERPGVVVNFLGGENSWRSVLASFAAAVVVLLSRSRRKRSGKGPLS